METREESRKGGGKVSGEKGNKADQIVIIYMYQISKVNVITVYHKHILIKIKCKKIKFPYY